MGGALDLPPGGWREVVNRSALTLKLLTSRLHGSVVAAATFGLPEEVGGERNWDYRYTWIRDASFTLYGLIRLGYTQEAGEFMKWIEARCAEPNDDGSLQIMYGIDGRHHLTEEHLPHLEGYLKSSPVRIGNGAYDQLQLDIYGELMDSVYLYDKYGDPISYDLWENLTHLVDWVCENWRRKDEGIWEVRGGQHAFLYSRIMCWVAIDRAFRLAHKRSLPAPLDRWHRVRTDIYREVFTKFWNEPRRAFVQHENTTAMDASALIMPLVRFIGPKDPRWMSTLRAIHQDLVDDSLVYRYRTEEVSRRPGGRRGDLLHLHLLVRGMRGAQRRSARGAIPVREGAGLRQPPRAVRRGAGPTRRAFGELPTGIHALGADQRRLRSGPASVGRRAAGLMGVAVNPGRFERYG